MSIQTDVAELRVEVKTLGREMGEVKKAVNSNGIAIAALNVAVKQNGKAKASGFGSIKTWVLIIGGAGLFFGALLFAVVVLVMKFAPEIAKVVE